MTPTEVTAVGGLVLSLIALVVLPVVFHRQTARQLKAQSEREEVKEQAKQDAAKAASDVVSWDGINRALQRTAQDAEIVHQKRITQLREDFAAETARLKQQTDYDLDRANARIRELAAQVESLERRLGAADSSSQQ